MEEKFSEFYENYKNKLDEIYIKFNQEKNKIERRFFLAMIVFLILFVFATYKLKLLFDSYAVFIIIGCVAIVASVMVGIFFVALSTTFALPLLWKEIVFKKKKNKSGN